MQGAKAPRSASKTEDTIIIDFSSFDLKNTARTGVDYSEPLSKKVQKYSVR